ncbi:MAG: flagellin [Pseudomonadota bacterium]
MTSSINTNPGALIALQNLNSINDRLAETQRRVSTGLQVSSAADNPALFALAQQQRAELGSVESVQQGLRVGQSTVDVALAAGDNVSDILVELRSVAVQAADASITDETRDILSERFVALRDQISRIVSSAEVGGRNLIASGANDLSLVAGTDGATQITVEAQDLSIGGANITISNDADPFAAVADDPLTPADESQSGAQAAQAQIAAIEASIVNVTNAVARLGNGSQALDLQDNLLSRVSDALETSIGNLVDADLARESSRLQALQVQQQLAIQTLSIANAAPNSILALFA